ncbi:complex I subunit 4 family protein [Desulfobacca acetoxidans]|uniref:Proton-translocating NADH-quinone oxidoreductase, chain M n=1 Tax=Desulfobacca acetoxidans (strain ATCC 700848 / DSM 11109 / ASRB2) TaxID=880072 RepID=F2NHF4_DESAR|nr:NADH-quinone oxidoreductase subunit M [Desulfobacca acetoxidans]AEB09070.1 proton-translocating NADH-quinone oxidoreductase, chain M [Desulfobacca acetoxidans DSM 11109]HAY22065.1 NADH-quinone oxidoreductase subunit M [Desulfobacterales bacterium]
MVEHLASFPYLTCMVLSPAIGLFIIVLLKEEQKFLIRAVSLVSAGISLGLSIYTFVGYDKVLGGLQFVEKYEWVKSFGITFFVGVDGINAPLLLLTGIVIFTGVLTMWELENRVKEYFAFMLFLVTGVFGVFMSMDIFFFFLFYEIAVVPMYILILIWGSTRKEYAAMKLTLYLMAGSGLIIPGILLLYSTSGLYTFDLIKLHGVHFPPEMQKIIFVLLLFGFGVLAAMWPFHTWSPVGHVAAPTAVSMLHAGVLMKLGSYGILRVPMYLCPEGFQYWSQLMGLLAICGIVYGVFVGLAQTDLKYVIGYSSVSHMGIVALGLATGTMDGLNGSVFQMFSHGVMTALFFSAVGYIYDRTHVRDIHLLGGFSKIMPVASAFFITAALCGAGLPGFASFWAELLVFIAAVKVFGIGGLIALASIVVGALFALRVVQTSFYNEPNPKFIHFEDVSPFLGLPRMILIATLILFGIFPSLMLDVIKTAVAPFISGL